MSDQTPQERKRRFYERKREATKEAVSAWLDNIADDTSNEITGIDPVEVPIYDPNNTRLSQPKSVDRYRAWQDYYTLEKLTSGRWKAVCLKCNEPYIRGPARGSKGKVYKSGQERVMDLVEAHIMGGCRTVADRWDLPSRSDLPKDPPF